jgi:hypothetical protein
MEADRFDSIARLLNGPTERRRALLGLSLSPLAWLVATRTSDITEAKQKRKRRKKTKKPKPNAYGCLDVGQPCSGDSTLCCSGICEGKKCRSHDTGSCPQDLEPEICLAGTIQDALKVLCDNSQSCGCYRTTSGSRYCSAFLYNVGDSRCADCQTDADRVALGFPPRAACAPVSRGRCAGACPTGMACLVPCGTELPPSPAT